MTTAVNCRCLLLAAVIFQSISTAAGAQLPVPSGLSPGDTYHLAFNSSSFTDGLSAQIETYNALVQAAADAAGIGTGQGISWKALASTSTVDARDNATVGVDTPIYNMNLELIATGLADLWDGTLQGELDWDEFGRSNFIDAWTGSQSDGRKAPGLTLGNLGGLAWCGRPTFKNNLWINFTTPPLSTSLHVYALSQELVVPLPGDYNNDGAVNAPDYTVWRDHYGTMAELPNDLLTGGIGQAHYRQWKSNYGMMQGGRASLGVRVPEPPAASLFFAVFLSLALLFGRRV